MIPQSKWVWYGYAGHLIVGSRCAYHLCTRIGVVLVSTVGDYRPNAHSGIADMETIDGGPKTFFETLVFECDGDDKDGNPNILSYSEIDGVRYATSVGAEKGHRTYCLKYARRKIKARP